MAVKKTKSDKTSTMTRCTDSAKKQILALSERLWEENRDYLKGMGINKATSALAVDALLYWAALHGELDGTPINSKNNVYCKLMSEMEEDNHE